jgi:TatD DNase family protein
VLVDSHAHLDDPAFAQDLPAVLERARAAGVRWIVTAGTDLASSQRSLALARQYPGVRVAVGVHPSAAATWTPETAAALRQLAADPLVVAIGEIGLDYYRPGAPAAVQQAVLWEQLRLASDLGRPVVLHNREATADLLALLHRWVAERSPARGVLHCFTGDLATAQRALDLGFFLSFGGILTFPKSEPLRAVAAAVPLERLLLETDSPYLAPQPVRGRRNEPAYLRYVAEGLAARRGLSLEAVAAQTTANARQLFGLPAE